MKLLICITLFIVLTSVNVEYGINRQDSTWLLIACLAIQAALTYFLIIPFIKKLLKK